MKVHELRLQSCLKAIGLLFFELTAFEYFEARAVLRVRTKFAYTSRHLRRKRKLFCVLAFRVPGRRLGNNAF